MILFVLSGKVVRELKAQRGDKSQIDLEVKKLLNLKAEYKVLTGREWAPSSGGGESKKKVKANVQAQAASKGENGLVLVT